jgi:ParB family chromosome partitioning protein
VGKKGLGKGLSALIPGLAEEKKLNVEEIPLSDISPNPNQPRQSFNEQSFFEMVESVRKFGVIQPIVVQPKGLGYEIVAGERRWRAAKEAGLKSIPAVIKRLEGPESLEIALIENLHREDLNAIEEAQAYKTIIEKFNITQEELAKKIGKSRVAVTNTLRLLELPEDVKEAIVAGNLSAGHARALLGLKDEKKIKSLAERVIAEGLSVRETEKLARLISLEKKKKPSVQPKAFREMARELSKILKTPVKVKMTSQKGKIEITFKKVEDLERIFSLLKKVGEEESQDEL